MKNSIILILLFLLVLIPLPVLSSEDAQGVQNLDSVEANKRIKQNRDNPDFVILDVRTPGEYSSGHIDKAVNIDYKSDNFKNEVNKLDKNKTYFVYCHSGRRTEASAEIMDQLGFKNVFNIGGVVQWQEAGYKLTKPESK